MSVHYSTQYSEHSTVDIFDSFLGSGMYIYGLVGRVILKIQLHREYSILIPNEHLALRLSNFSILIVQL